MRSFAPSVKPASPRISFGTRLAVDRERVRPSTRIFTGVLEVWQAERMNRRTRTSPINFLMCEIIVDSSKIKACPKSFPVTATRWLNKSALCGNARDRQETGLFLVEGIHHVGEAVEAGWRIETLVYAPDQLTSDFARRLVEEQFQRQGPLCGLDPGPVRAGSRKG